MTWNRLRPLLGVSCVAAVMAAGCGQGSPLSSGSPGTLIGPTALTQSVEADVAGLSSVSDDTFGRLAKGGNGGGSGDDEEKDRGRKGGDDDVEGTVDEENGAKPPKTSRGSLSGFVTTVTPTTITVRGIVVTVNADTEIRHGNRQLTIADIQEGDHVQVKGTTTTTATDTTFTATEIKVEDMDHLDDADADDDDADAKIVGKIAALAGTCPALTFDVLSGTGVVTTTKVGTNADTNFHQVLCTALANDAIVEVKGTTQTDGSILATKVSLED